MNGNRSGQPRPTKAIDLFKIEKAKEAIERLIELEGFFPGNKADFAIEMGWVDHLKNRKPDRRLVDEVCNLTRDQRYSATVQDALAGYVIAYSSSDGGIVLVDPSGETQIRQWIKIFKGDFQKQQAIRTMNRRRQPTWEALGKQLAANGDVEFASICWQIEIEIKRTGDVSDEMISKFFMTLASREPEAV